MVKVYQLSVNGAWENQVLAYLNSEKACVAIHY